MRDASFSKSGNDDIVGYVREGVTLESVSVADGEQRVRRVNWMQAAGSGFATAIGPRPPNAPFRASPPQLDRVNGSSSPLHILKTLMQHWGGFPDVCAQLHTIFSATQNP